MLTDIVEDRETHTWVAEIATKLDDHDPVDALHDVEVLLALCKARLTRE